MKDVIDIILATPTTTLLMVAGFVFLFISVVGNVAGKIEPGKAGRIAAGVIGGILLVTGLALQMTATKIEKHAEEAQQAVEAEAGNKDEENRRQAEEVAKAKEGAALEDQARKERQADEARQVVDAQARKKDEENRRQAEEIAKAKERAALEDQARTQRQADEARQAVDAQARKKDEENRRQAEEISKAKERAALDRARKQRQAEGEQTTDGWAIIGSYQRGNFSELVLSIDGDTPAIGRSYKATQDFRLVQKRPEDDRSRAVITLGMVHRGDSVEVLDIKIAPGTRTVPVYAKLRAVLHSVRRRSR